MAEGPAGDQRGGSMDTDQGVVIQHEQPSIPKVSRGFFSPGNSGEAASLSLAATADPAPVRKKPGCYSEKGYLMELSSQQRLRIQEEIKNKFKPGEIINAPINVLPQVPPHRLWVGI